MKVIREEVNRLNRLAGKIRELLVAPEGSPRLIHLSDYLEQLQKHHDNNIVIEGSPDVYINIDQDHLTSILENLIHNALQAGSATPIRISVEQRRHEIIVGVHDSGSGIDAQLLDRLFSPFTTSKSDGSGLGLAISRTFARAAGGDLYIANTSPAGTTVALSLPEVS